MNGKTISKLNLSECLFLVMRYRNCEDNPIYKEALRIVQDENIPQHDREKMDFCVSEIKAFHKSIYRECSAWMRVFGSWRKLFAKYSAPGDTDINSLLKEYYEQ